MSQENDDSSKSMNIIRDCPVDDFGVDAFGYKNIAKEVAASICQLHSDSGYVIAINGKWGSGKSSFLFYTEKYLTENCNELEIGR
jgi:predicted KAP-like P-loop ATPase